VSRVKGRLGRATRSGRAWLGPGRGQLLSVRGGEGQDAKGRNEAEAGESRRHMNGPVQEVMRPT
jgi:hypothetical protein